MRTWLNVYNLISLVALALQVFFLVNALRRRDRYTKAFGATLGFSLLTLASNWLMYIAPSQLLATIFATAFVSSFVCTELGISLFIMRYTNAEKHMLNVIRVTSLLVVLFIVFYIVNMFTGVLFTMERVTIDGCECWMASFTKLVWIHNVFIGLLELQIAAQLVVRAVIAPAIYKHRYIVMAVVYCGIWVLNGVTHIIKTPTDFSVVAFALFSGFVSMFVSYRVPGTLVQSMIRMANNSMNDGLLCFDNTGRLIFSNHTAKKIFATERNPEQAMVQYRFNRLDQPKNMSAYEELWEESFVLEGQEHIYDVRYMQIQESGQFLGSYLQFTDKTDELLMYEQQRYQATHDTLTGIYNRERFFMEAEKRKNEFPNIQWLMLVSNIRDFRLVNELFGEELGDAVLVREAENFRKYCHRTSLYGRIMDDKFALLMDKRYFSPDMILAFMDDVKSLAENHNYRMHLQVGIYEVTDAKESIHLIYDKAVSALPNIKSEYQKVFAYYDSHQMEERLKEHRIIEDFDQAMENGEFQMFLQAQYDAQGNVQGADVIPCLASEHRGILTGKELRSIVEHSGAVHKLDEYIWDKAFSLLGEWKKTYPNWYMSIQISAMDLYYIDVIEVLSRLLKQYDVNPKNVHLEIDESTLMLNPKNNVPLLSELHELGFYVVISEFGNGYSSLNMLKDMHPDAIRLDHMVDPEEDGGEDRGRIVIKAILSMARRLGIQTIVSDIQTEEEKNFIVENHADIYQGSYFSYPASVEDFFKMTEWKPE